MDIRKYALFIIAVISIQIAVSQTTPSIRVVSTNNTPALAIYGAGGAYKGYLWNKGAEDIELGTVGTTGNLHISVNGNEKISVFKNGQVAINGPASTTSFYGILSSFTVNGLLTVRDIRPGNETWSFESYTPAHQFFIYQNSTVRTYLNHDGDWIAQSDLKLKQNISQYKNVMDGIKKLTISTYEYKSHPGSKRSFGLIAQNVQESFPEIVSEFTGKDGQMFLGIAYGKTGVLALKAVQEQQQVIENLQQKIERLEILVTELLNKK